ncbi:hypothetical protein ABH922_002755 [Rhodococcus sp. 27YEA15]|uniref:hypothetical protein n=1 Tax=Rhodococcus sp. 27YEA15 TaxID=3156259 RepID=UPI003C7D3406
MTDVTAAIRSRPSTGAELRVEFDGHTYTLPRLIEHVRNLESAQDQLVGERADYHRQVIRKPIDHMFLGTASTEELAARDRRPAGKGFSDAELDPIISARYDRPLNQIAISVEGEDDVYLPRGNAFSFMDQIAQALEVQAKLGGAA